MFEELVLPVFVMTISPGSRVLDTISKVYLTYRLPGCWK